MAKWLPMQTRGPSPNGMYAPFGSRRMQVALPALGAEGLGVVEPAGVAVEDPLRDQQLRPLRDGVAADLERLDRLAADRPGGRIEPHRLADDVARVGQPGHVGGRRGPAVAEDLVELGREPGLGLGVAGEQVEGVGQRQRGGLVAGEEEGHALVAELPVGHARPPRRPARRAGARGGRRGRGRRRGGGG